MNVLQSILTFLVLTQECKAVNLFDIHKVEFLKSPVTCSSYITLAIVIHSHPEHNELRNTLRQTWAQETQNTRRVFIVGITDNDNTLARDAIIKESEEFGDVVQGDFIDSYRNMTYKHLLGYRWINEHCSNASYVLKSDDDQFVDTLQLGRYLSAFLPAPGSAWYLCQVLRSAPHRDPDSKWAVTREEWPGEEYPEYCAGWAYVTTPATVTKVLDQSTRMAYFWIDDIHVTGAVREALKEDVLLYNWVNSFLTTHIQYSSEILRGSFYTPELMVCGDIKAEEIRHVWGKAVKCQKKDCYSLVYDDKNNRESVAPVIHQTGRNREEL